MDNDTKEWLKSVLSSNIVKVVFEKVDGTMRTMNATLDTNKIPSDKAPKNTGRKQSDTAIVAFDVDKSEWRSFRVDSVKSVSIEVD